MRPLLLIAALLVPLASQAELAPPDQVVIHAVAVEVMPPSVEASPLEQLKAYATPANLATAIGTVASLGAFAAYLTQRRKKLLALVVKNVFYMSEDAANETTDPRFDKLAAALKFADAWCVAHGWRPLTPGEQAIATLQLQAQHGEEIAKAKVAEAGAAVTQ